MLPQPVPGIASSGDVSKEVHVIQRCGDGCIVACRDIFSSCVALYLLVPSRSSPQTQLLASLCVSMQQQQENAQTLCWCASLTNYDFVSEFVL
jgi:hypothetical protein